MLDVPVVVLNGLGVVGLWSMFGYLILTDKLVHHSRLTEAKKERDHWRDMALRGLGVAEKTTAYAEVATELIVRPNDGGSL